MLGLGVPELLIIAFMVVVLFGYKRIPQIFGGLGQGIRDFKKGLKEEPSDNDSGSAQLDSDNPSS